MQKNKLIRRLRTYGVSCCVSYTFVSMIFSVLSMSNHVISDNPWQTHLELFAVCAAIALLMFFSDTLLHQEDDTMTVTGFFVGLCDVAIPVIGLGGFLFQWFNPLSTQIILPIIILLCVYLAIFVLFYLNAKHTEKELNRKINERKERLQHDKENH